MDRMREAVFAVLGDLDGRSFLDLFTGSGIVALEASSRGADPVEAVEMDRLKRQTLLRNVSMAPRRIHCRFMAAELYITRAQRPFGLIFCDPPFDYRFKEELLRSIAASPLMDRETILLLHRPREDLLTDLPLNLRDSRRFGRSVVDFFSLF
jgi:16S rRNA (guanine(966)-N(2))-methyltransferase RsmD